MDYRTDKQLVEDREGILRYLGERHTEWGFGRAETELARIDAEVKKRRGDRLPVLVPKW